MQAFGISSLVLAILAIITPIAGVFLTGLSGVLAFFSAGKSTGLGFSAVILNIINIIFLSPSLVIVAANSRQAGEASSSVSTAFGVLLLIQIIAIVVFIAQFAWSKRK